MNIILFGPPGAGKGTQGDNLVKDYNLSKISTGDLLRKEISKKSSLGEKIKQIIDEGRFVSDEIINNLVETILSNKAYFNRLIFDGYPRTLSQAKTLESLMIKYRQKISGIFSLNVDENIVIKRILGRQVCSKCGLIFNEFFNPSTAKNHDCDQKFLEKRSDDNKEIVANRFETYKNETIPILNYYRNQKALHEIDGMGNINQIYKEICSIITSLET